MPELHNVADGCMIQGPAACDLCRYARNGTDCVPRCPHFTYVDDNGRCRPCHDLCRFIAGCSGPTNKLGSRGCKACSHMWIGRHEDDRNCLSTNVTCETDFYEETEVDTTSCTLIFTEQRKFRLTSFEI